MVPSWGHLGAVLGPSWGPLGPSWALLGPLGAILGPLGASWGHPGVCWGHLGTIFGPLWSVFGPSRGHLGPNLGPLGSSLGPLGVMGGFLEPSADHFGTAPASRQNRQKPSGKLMFLSMYGRLVCLEIKFLKDLPGYLGLCWGCWGLCWGLCWVSWLPGWGSDSMPGPLGRIDVCLGRVPAASPRVPLGVGAPQGRSGGEGLTPLPGPFPQTETEDYPPHAGPGVGGFLWSAWFAKLCLVGLRWYGLGMG